MCVSYDPNYMSSHIIQGNVFVLHHAAREQTGNPSQKKKKKGWVDFFKMLTLILIAAIARPESQSYLCTP